MIVLALDSSAAACSVAIRDDAGTLLAHRRKAMMRGHAELLMPMVRETMAEAGVDFSALALIAAFHGTRWPTERAVHGGAGLFHAVLPWCN